MGTITLNIEACFYTYYITDGTTNGCGNEVGAIPYFAAEYGYNLVTKFYTNSSLTTIYTPGAGTIGFNFISGPITLTAYVADIDIDGNLSNHTPCV